MTVQTLLHLVFMVLSAVLIVTAAVVAYKKSGVEWLKKHRMFAVIGALSAYAGALIMFLYKTICICSEFY